jgi:hypothetical protein
MSIGEYTAGYLHRRCRCRSSHATNLAILTSIDTEPSITAPLWRSNSRHRCHARHHTTLGLTITCRGLTAAQIGAWRRWETLGGEGWASPTQVVERDGGGEPTRVGRLRRPELHGMCPPTHATKRERGVRRLLRQRRRHSSKDQPGPVPQIERDGCCSFWMEIGDGSYLLWSSPFFLPLGRATGTRKG